MNRLWIVLGDFWITSRSSTGLAYQAECKNLKAAFVTLSEYDNYDSQYYKYVGPDETGPSMYYCHSKRNCAWYIQPVVVSIP